MSEDSWNRIAVQFVSTSELLRQYDQQQAEIKRLTDELEFYRTRCEVLQMEQSKFREPERTVLCNVLANGSIAASISAAQLLWKDAAYDVVGGDDE